MATNKNFSEKVITKRFLHMVAKFNEELDAKEEAYLYCEGEEEGEEEKEAEAAANSAAEAAAAVVKAEAAAKRAADILAAFIQAKEEAAEESADKAESAADKSETCLGDAEYFAAKVTTAADAKEAAKYQEAAAVAADMAESFADKAENFADAAAFAAKVTTAADAETKKAAEISANRAAKAADMATKAAAEARRVANQAAAEAFAAFAAPESGEARKADILAKLAAAYDTTKNKSIAITLDNYINTAEGIAAEEFTKALYYWYVGALLRFGFNLEAAAPESGRAAEESKTAAEYQEAAADLIKTAAAVAFGFVGFYLTFAIFGV